MIDRWSHNLAFDAEITINKEDELIVVDKAKYFVMKELVEYPFKISLSPQEAFYIFSNISVNGIRAYIDIIDSEQLESLQEVLSQRYDINRTVKREYAKYSEKGIKYAYGYIIAYLEYVKEQLLQKKIHPYEILRLGGAHTLSILAALPPIRNFILKTIENFKLPHFSHSQKIIFYCLLHTFKSPSCDRESIIGEINHALKFSYGGIVKHLEAEILKPFPTAGKPNKMFRPF